MSKYRMDEAELLRAKQLLEHVEGQLEVARSKVITAYNNLYGQQGFGIEQERYTLDTQTAVLRMQINNVINLRECIQSIIDTTIMAGNNAKVEIDTFGLAAELEEAKVNADTGTSSVKGKYATGLSGAGAVQSIKAFYDYSKGIKKGLSGVQDVFDILDILDIEGMKDLGKAESEYFGELLDSPFFKITGQLAKGEKIFTAIQKGDGEALIDMAVKEYAKDNGVEGFKFEAYYTMAKVWGENYVDYLNKCQTEELTVGDYASAFWSLSGGMILETGCEIAYDKLTDIIPWYDEYYGGDVSGFYEKLGEIKDSVKDAYGIKGIGDGIVKIGKNTVSFYAEKIANIFR